MPRAESKSPVELLFGRKQRTALPTLARHHQQIDIDAAAKKRDVTYERPKNTYNKGMWHYVLIMVSAKIIKTLNTSVSARSLIIRDVQILQIALFAFFKIYLHFLHFFNFCVERTFSSLRDLNTPKRNRFTEEHIKDALIIQWNSHTAL